MLYVHRTWRRFHLRPSRMEAQHEKRVKLVFLDEKTQYHQNGGGEMAMETYTRLRIWPFAFAPPPYSWPQTRATPGRREGHMLASSACSHGHSHLNHSGNKSFEWQYTRGQCLTLTWMSPFMVDISEECTSFSYLHTAGYSSKRDTVHTRTQRTISAHYFSIVYYQRLWSTSIKKTPLYFIVTILNNQNTMRTH